MKVQLIVNLEIDIDDPSKVEQIIQEMDYGFTCNENEDPEYDEDNEHLMTDLYFDHYCNVDHELIKDTEIIGWKIIE